MKGLYQILMTDSAWAKEVGLFVLRVGIGLIYMRHGVVKIFNMGEIIWHGQQMANVGITFWPLLWGIAAVYTEFLGGIALVLGCYTRVACLFMAFTMFVAVIYHIKKGDPWGYISYPLAMMVVFIAIMIMGGGKYSLDMRWLAK